MTDTEKADWKARMAAAKAAKAAARASTPSTPPVIPTGRTSARLASRPQKSAHEIELEKANAVLEDRLEDLEKFVKSLGTAPATVTPKLPKLAPAAPAAKGWWENFLES